MAAIAAPVSVAVAVTGVSTLAIATPAYRSGNVCNAPAPILDKFAAVIAEDICHTVKIITIAVVSRPTPSNTVGVAITGQPVGWLPYYRTFYLFEMVLYYQPSYS